MTDAVETTDDVETPDEVEPGVEEQEDPTEGLKKALQAERKARKEAERKAREALAAKEPEGDAIDLARREAAAEATRTISNRIIQAELKAALADKVENPARVLRLIDTTDVVVGDDGSVDEADIADAITSFLNDYPEFKKDSARFTGSADQFTKGRQPAKPEKPNPNDLIRAAFKKD